MICLLFTESKLPKLPRFYFYYRNLQKQCKDCAAKTSYKTFTRDSRRWNAWRRNKESGLSYKSMLEIGPLIRIASPWRAHFWHSFDNFLAKHVIPYIEITQESSKWLCVIQATCKWILFLTQHQWTTRSNHVTCFEVCCICRKHAVFVEVHQASGVLPSYTNVMPLVVIGRHW